MQLGVTITDIAGKIVYTNSAEARIHGCTVDELIGRDVSVFCLPGYRRSLSSEQLRRMKSWRRESMNVRKDGTLLPVALMSDVVLDARDQPIGVVTTCEDLTEAKRAAAERERGRARWRGGPRFQQRPDGNIGVCKPRLERASAPRVSSTRQSNRDTEWRPSIGATDQSASRLFRSRPLQDGTGQRKRHRERVDPPH
jgi:PAS domain S-box-containing protein